MLVEQGLVQVSDGPAEQHPTTAHLRTAQLLHGLVAGQVVPEKNLQLLAETRGGTTAAEAPGRRQPRHL